MVFQRFSVTAYPQHTTCSNPISSSLPILKNLMSTSAFSLPPTSNVLFLSATLFFCPGHPASFSGVLSLCCFPLPPSVAMPVSRVPLSHLHSCCPCLGFKEWEVIQGTAATMTPFKFLMAKLWILNLESYSIECVGKRPLSSNLLFHI